MGWRNRGFPCSESRGPARTRVVAYPPSDTGFWRMRPSSVSCVAFLHVRRHSPKHAAAACGGRPATAWSLRFTFLVRFGLSVFVLLKNFAYHVLSVVWAPFLSPVSAMSACPFFRGVAPCLAWAPRAEELSGLRVVQAFPERPDRGTWGFFISFTRFVVGAVPLFRQSPVAADRKRRPPPQLGVLCPRGWRPAGFRVALSHVLLFAPSRQRGGAAVHHLPCSVRSG